MQRGNRERRNRVVPSYLLVLFLASTMSLCFSDSMKDVLKNLVDGLSEERIKLPQRSHIRCKAAITKAET